MSGEGFELRVEDVEAAVQAEQKTPGGVKLDIVLSPATKILQKSPSQSTTPATREEIEVKLTAAASRREMLDQLRAKSISSQLAKIEVVQSKKEELNVEKSTKSKEVLESKLTTQEKNRAEQLQKSKEKMAEQLAKVERAQKELEIQTEAARLSAECALNAKLTKAQEKRVEQLEVTVKKMKEHKEYVAEVRSSCDRQFTELESKFESELNMKMEKAAKEKERQEMELKEKAEERNRKAEVVRKNKEKIMIEANTGPQSA